jgi:formylglycine-generating enzyme required for sulfatase activity
MAEEGMAAMGMLEARPRIEKALEPFTTRHALRQLLILHDEGQPDANFTDVPAGQLRDYIYLTRATAEPPPEPERKVTIPVPEVVPVPAGPFTMGTRREDIPALVEKYGSEAGRYEREVPQHGVDLPAFKIGKYPVTNREYQAFVRGAGYRPPFHWDGDEYPAGKGDHPVVYVTWHDAVAYCRWLTEQTGQLYRLPTEAEWEKAARGSDGRQYPWGNEFDPARCNSVAGGPGETTPVGQYPEGASPYGILDMAGNVWEWCSTLYNPIPTIQAMGGRTRRRRATGCCAGARSTMKRGAFAAPTAAGTARAATSGAATVFGWWRPPSPLDSDSSGLWGSGIPGSGGGRRRWGRGCRRSAT